MNIKKVSITNQLLLIFVLISFVYSMIPMKEITMWKTPLPNLKEVAKLSLCIEF
jgi:hypothetical protein